MKTLRLSLLLLTTLPLWAQTRTTQLSPEVIYARCKGSVVTILTFDAKQAPLGQGSGFVVAKNRILTNYHVLAGSSSASVLYDDGTFAQINGVTAGSLPNDIAIVSVDTGNRSPLSLGNELDLKVGETLYAIGSPKGLAASLSNGLVSGFREEEGQFLIQMTAAIAPGSSGGPVFNRQGQVIGVATSRLKDAGFGFAVGASNIRQLLKVPLPAMVDLSVLTPDEEPVPDNSLSAVQELYSSKKYAESLRAFNTLPNSARSSFSGQLLLCQIYRQNQAKPMNMPSPQMLVIRQSDRSQVMPKPTVRRRPFFSQCLTTLRPSNQTLKAQQLSDEIYFKNLVGFVYYLEEKYPLVSKQFPQDTKDAFSLALLPRSYEAPQRISGLGFDCRLKSDGVLVLLRHQPSGLGCSIL